MFLPLLSLLGCPVTGADTGETGGDSTALAAPAPGPLAASQRHQGQANGEFSGAVTGCGDPTVTLVGDAAAYDALVTSISNCGGECPSSEYEFANEMVLVAWVYCTDLCERELTLAEGVVGEDTSVALTYTLDTSISGSCGDSVVAEFVTHAVPRAAYGTLSTSLTRTSDGT